MTVTLYILVLGMQMNTYRTLYDGLGNCVHSQQEEKPHLRSGQGMAPTQSCFEHKDTNFLALADLTTHLEPSHFATRTIYFGI